MERKATDINAGVARCRETPGAVLLDVRTPEEYRDGHIPGSVNIPLQQLEEIASVIPDTDTPLFVYCRSGVRSRRAAAYLTHLAYASVTDLGGILGYRGRAEREA